MAHRASIAFGSNLGDRAGFISQALRAIGRFCTVERTASLYESPPAYVTEQPPFLNTVCHVRTSLPPRELLASLKGVERELGRRSGGVRFGPREIDLDLLLYGEEAVLHEAADPHAADPHGAAAFGLELPHPRLAERTFVLRPLAELDPSQRHPTLGRSVAELLAEVEQREEREAAAQGQAAPPPLLRVTPMGESLLRWGRRTHVMGVLNVTPDSFSDGGSYFDAGAAVAHALAMQEAGADIIDVGAQSTRPGAVLVPPDEEVRRAAPVVQALRASGQLRVPISIDTNSSVVAREVVACGAHCVNDVSGGVHDPAMLPTLAALGVPAVLMHMRGEPATMASLATYGDVVEEVRAELLERLHAAEAAGLPRWHIISDPGIGFAKTAEHNLALLGRLDRFGLESLGYPMLLGVSRKSFIGHVLGGAPPRERVWGTAAACALGIPHADILRVHDVREMREVAAVADAITRRAPVHAEGGGTS